MCGFHIGTGAALAFCSSKYNGAPLGIGLFSYMFASVLTAITLK